jgi:hypothetical protein
MKFIEEQKIYLSVSVTNKMMRPSFGQQDRRRREWSIDFLRPKLRILYFVWKKGGFQNNMSALSRALGYSDDEPVRRMVHELLNEKYLEVKIVKGRELIKITKSGMRKISLLIYPQFLLIFILFLSVDLVCIGANELFFGLRMPPLNYILMGVTCFIFTILMVYMWKLLENGFLQIGGEAPPK